MWRVCSQPSRVTDYQFVEIKTATEYHIWYIYCSRLPQTATDCNLHRFTPICINLFQFASKRDLLGDPGVPLRSVNGPAYDMDVSHPDTLCGSILDAIRPVSRPSPGSKGSKKGPTNGNFHSLAVLTPKTA